MILSNKTPVFFKNLFLFTSLLYLLYPGLDGSLFLRVVDYGCQKHETLQRLCLGEAHGNGMPVFIIFKSHIISGIRVQKVCREHGGYGVGTSRLDLFLFGRKYLHAVLALYYPKVNRAGIDTVALICDMKSHIAFITYTKALLSNRLSATPR